MIHYMLRSSLLGFGFLRLLVPREMKEVVVFVPYAGYSLEAALFFGSI